MFCPQSGDICLDNFQTIIIIIIIGRLAIHFLGRKQVSKQAKLISYSYKCAVRKQLSHSLDKMADMLTMAAIAFHTHTHLAVVHFSRSLDKKFILCQSHLLITTTDKWALILYWKFSYKHESIPMFLMIRIREGNERKNDFLYSYESKSIKLTADQHKMPENQLEIKSWFVGVKLQIGRPSCCFLSYPPLCLQIQNQFHLCVSCLITLD